MMDGNNVNLIAKYKVTSFLLQHVLIQKNVIHKINNFILVGIRNKALTADFLKKFKFFDMYNFTHFIAVTKIKKDISTVNKIKLKMHISKIGSQIMLFFVSYF